MLCAPVFTFTSGSSAFLGHPRCGLSIWLLLLAIFNTLFCIYAQNNFTRKRTKHENTQVRHFCMIWKWLPTNLLGVQSINTERASLGIMWVLHTCMYDFYRFFGVKTVGQCVASYLGFLLVLIYMYMYKYMSLTHFHVISFTFHICTEWIQVPHHVRITPKTTTSVCRASRRLYWYFFKVCVGLFIICNLQCWVERVQVI